MEKEQRLHAQAANAKLVHLNEQLVFPLLQRNIDQAIISMCQELKARGVADISKVAYIAACVDLREELIAIARQGDRAVSVLNKKEF